ncbi:MAG: hypothetical protein K9G30_00955 [Parvibaculum sp.]|nr:hypothetical protein [Parvibaculum sp.]
MANTDKDKDKDQKEGDEILRRLLKTPPQPKEAEKKPKRKPKKEKPAD